VSQSRRKTNAPAASGEFLAFEKVSIAVGEATVFKHTTWTWHAGEQWAMLGPDGSGKSLLVQAILGRAPISHGEVRGPYPERGAGGAPPAPTIAHVSPQTQRDMAAQEGSFYQHRWHSGLEQGPRTVAEFLSQESVEERNPFEVGWLRSNPSRFLRLRRQFVDWLGIKGLWRRRLIHLSNGEMRRTLLVSALLKSPDLLILEDAYAGLDAATRRKLDRVISRLMREGCPILVATHRVEEVPAATTHVLLVNDYQVLAQGPKQRMLGVWRKRFGANRRLRPPVPQGPQPPRKRTALGQPLVDLRRVTVAGGRRRILHDLSWTLREGECWALLGPNGAGKTTLLNLIQGDHPQAYSQDIRLFGRRTDSTQALWRARQHIGWMSPELHQHYPAGWDAEAVVCSGFFNSIGLHEPCTRRRGGRARQWLVDLGLGNYARTPFGELSFGRQRLVLLARSVVKQPRLLILDEPCQGLDKAQRRALLSAVDRVVTQTAASLIFVTHHQDEVPRCISHILHLAAGRIRRATAVYGSTHKI
jgi:molybdate transport system ATP-binding protein